MLLFDDDDNVEMKQQGEQEEDENAEIGDIYALCHIVLPQIPCTYGSVLLAAL